jgi:ABC-type multidrug transport system ATPase subunit
MDEAGRLADRIAVIAAGRIVATGTPRTLGGRDRMAATIRFTLPDLTHPGELPPELRALALGEDGQRLRLATETPLIHVRASAVQEHLRSQLEDTGGRPDLTENEIELVRFIRQGSFDWAGSRRSSSGSVVGS